MHRTDIARPQSHWVAAALVMALGLTLAQIAWTAMTDDIAARIAAEAGATGQWGAAK